MQAKPGDHIVVKGHHLHEPLRECEVLEAHGPDGEPPYLVRWASDGHESLFFPGTDATLSRASRT